MRDLSFEMPSYYPGPGVSFILMLKNYVLTLFFEWIDIVLTPFQLMFPLSGVMSISVLLKQDDAIFTPFFDRVDWSAYCPGPGTSSYFLLGVISLEPNL